VTGPIDWDAELSKAAAGGASGDRTPLPPARDGVKALNKDADGAAEFVEQTGWHVHPVRVVTQIDGTTRKTPLSKWQAEATNDPGAARELWTRVGGWAAVGVNAGLSDLVVVDQDAVEVPVTWAAALSISTTLTLSSATKAAPHYVYHQPADQEHPQDRIGKGVWPAGDVLGDGGYLLMSSRPPITDHAVATVTGTLLDLLRKTVGPSRAAERWKRSHERVALSRLDPEEVRLPEDDPRWEFLKEAMRKFRQGCLEKPRRQAALDASWHVVIEASAGLYPTEVAIEELRQAYEYMREADPDGHGGDGWTPAREADFETMVVGALMAAEGGEMDSQIEETRARLGSFIDAVETEQAVVWDAEEGRFKRRGE